MTTTTVQPFEPIGDRARWLELYELLLTRGVGETVTYDQLADAVELDPVRDRAKLRGAFRRAARQYETVDNRAVEPVRRIGYRVVEPAEHLRLAKDQQRKSGRALLRGQSKVTHVDYTGMTPEVRHSFEMTGRALAVLVDYSRRLDGRQTRLEEALGSMSTRQDRSDQEVAELRARLARLERPEQ